MKEYKIGEQIILEAQRAIDGCTKCFFQKFCEIASSGKIPIEAAKIIMRNTPNCFIDNYQNKIIFIEKQTK